MASGKSTGAACLTRALAAAQIDTLFALSGNQIMPIFDACIDAGQRIVHVRHEAAAVHMGDAWSRLTGKPGVALLTAGPGFANALGAIYAARMSEAPVLVISGHAPTGRLGQGAFQEMPQAEMAAGVAKASWCVTRAEDVAEAVASALAIAVSGRPGPVHLAVPADVLQASVEPAEATRGERHAPPPGDAALADTLRALRAAKRPLILHGPALTHPAAAGLGRRVQAATGVPVVGMESPRGLNDPALGAFAEVMPEADLVLLLGKSVDFMLGFAEPPALSADCRFLQIEPEAEQRERARAMLGDRRQAVVDAAPAPAARALAATGGAFGDAGWRGAVEEAVAYRPAEWSEASAGEPGRVHPARLGMAIHEVVRRDPNAVLIVDGGEVGQWIQATATAPRRLINGPAGGIGSALPFALAARLAEPSAPVVAAMGDGTAGFHLSEFETAARERLPFVAVVGNDRRWNAEHQIQLRQYGADRLYGCELSGARYDRACAALGGHGERVDAEGDVAGALDRARQSGQPACVEVALDGQPAPLIRRTSPAGAATH